MKEEKRNVHITARLTEQNLADLDDLGNVYETKNRSVILSKVIEKMHQIELNKLQNPAVIQAEYDRKLNECKEILNEAVEKISQIS